MERRRWGATAQAWDRPHPRLTRRAAWLDHDGPLPITEGTVVRLVVEKLPSRGVNKPVWLWWSETGATSDDVDRCSQSFLCCFDLEHTFRLFKQTLGWTKPRLRSSERPPESGGGSETCAQGPAPRPVHRNRPAPPTTEGHQTTALYINDDKLSMR